MEGITDSKAGVRKTTWCVRIDCGERMKVGFNKVLRLVEDRSVFECGCKASGVWKDGGDLDRWGSATDTKPAP